MQNGAKVLYETDDDNFAESLAVFMMGAPRKLLFPNARNLTHNPAQHFGQVSMWPRGFPLDHLGIEPVRDYKLCTTNLPAIQQGLVYADPDLDAVFRMVRKIRPGVTELNFDPNAPVIVYPENVYTPFNSQNTFYLYRAFWALYLFKTVTDRETDIYRSYWAQRLMWLTSDKLAYIPPATVQKRNMWHKNVDDARYETRLYSYMSKFISHLDSYQCSAQFFFDCMTHSIRSLLDAGFVDYDELPFMEAWVHDLASVGYAPPVLHKEKDPCSSGDHLDVVYYPVEQKVDLNYLKEQVVPQDSDCRENIRATVTGVCGYEAGAKVLPKMETLPKLEHVLLVVAVQTLDVIPKLNAFYRLRFPLVLYCGMEDLSRPHWEKWRVSYVNVGKYNDAFNCMGVAVDMRYKVDGYLFATENSMVTYESVQQAAQHRDKVWLSDSLLLANDQTGICKSVRCITARKALLGRLAITTIQQHIVDEALKMKVDACAASTNKALMSLSGEAQLSEDAVLYVPSKLEDSLQQLRAALVSDAPSLKGRNHAALLLLQCLVGESVSLRSSQLPVNATQQPDPDAILFPFMFAQIQNNLSQQVHNRLFCSSFV